MIEFTEHDRAVLRNAANHAQCIDCRRVVDARDQKFALTATLPREDFCAWCSKPRSERAHELGSASARATTREFADAYADLLGAA